MGYMPSWWPVAKVALLLHMDPRVVASMGDGWINTILNAYHAICQYEEHQAQQQSYG